MCTERSGGHPGDTHHFGRCEGNPLLYSIPHHVLGRRFCAALRGRDGSPQRSCEPTAQFKLCAESKPIGILQRGSHEALDLASVFVTFARPQTLRELKCCTRTNDVLTEQTRTKRGD